jgi:hypothetical protein
MASRTAVLIGLGRGQEPYIPILKEMGLDLLGIDRDQGAICVGLVDKYMQISIDEPESVLELLIKNDVKPVLCLSEGSDTGAIALGLINTHFSLLGPKLASLILTRDKSLQRQVAAYSGCFQPAIIQFPMPSDVVRNKRLIKKPRRGQSSIGVEEITQGEVEQGIFSSGELERFQVEELIDGSDISVDGLVSFGNPLITVVAEKYKHQTNPFVDKLLWCKRPTSVEEKQFANLVRSLACYFGVEHSLFHSEWKLKDGKPCLIEISWRGGGSLLGSDVASGIIGRSVPRTHIMALSANYAAVDAQDSRDINCLMVFVSDDLELGRVVDLGQDACVEKRVVYLSETTTLITDCRSRYACIYLYCKADQGEQLRNLLLDNILDVKF